MKKFVSHLLTLLVFVSFCLSAQAQSFSIFKADGTTSVYQVSEVDSIVFHPAESSVQFALSGTDAAYVNGNLIVVQLPYSTDLTSLVATFDFGVEGSVFVDNIEQESGVTVCDFSSPVTYNVLPDEGDELSYIVVVSHCDLPILYINTPGSAPVDSKEIWVEGTTMVLAGAGEHDVVFTEANIRGRGNSTWKYKKKPYAIKLDSKEKVLGMPKHKRWVLLANWMDRTLMRNAVAFEIARRMPGLDWTPRGQFIEVVLNGQFLGNYYLCEQIRVDKNRVNITEMESEDVSDETITGGYLLEMDKNYDEVNKFRTAKRRLPVNIKDPDEDVLVTDQFNYIQQYVNDAEAALYASDFATAGLYQQYIDLPSFVDWWLVYELTGNEEPLHPKSCYMHKDRNGLLKAGPVWDFDWGTYKTGTSGLLEMDVNCIWYGQLFSDPVFKALVKERWTEVKPLLSDISQFIDDQAELIRDSEAANHALWPINQTVNYDEKMTFDAAVERMKQALQERIAIIDAAVSAY